MSQRILRSPREINLMRRAGLLVWQAHQAAARLIHPGVTTAALNQAVAEVFALENAKPLFLNYPGKVPFPAETCISINEEVVHGIPSGRALAEGDIVSLDTGCKVAGWCGDAAITHAVGSVSPEAQRLLDTTAGALNLSIELIGKKSLWSEIAREMQDYVESAGFSVVKSMVGHGIGKELHEPPQVPNYYSKQFADQEDFDLKPGVVIAVEPMVNAGTHELRMLKDHWTTITDDERLSAHFEHTIAITSSGPRILTGPPTNDELELVPEEFRNSEQWVNW